MTTKELILTHILKCSRAELYLKKVQLNSAQEELFNEITARCEAGEPLQYILGECEFLGYMLRVDPRVLIPRPETELLVDEIIKQMSKSSGQAKPFFGLDIGTGSGNITIALAKAFPLLTMTAIDISAGALEVAKENAHLNRVADRVKFVNDDVFHRFSAKDVVSRQFSLIVSNPPYVRTQDLSSLPPHVKKEPAMALDGGEDGLKFYRHIISHIHQALVPGGWLFLEIGEAQGKSLENLLTVQGSFVNIHIIKDFNQRDRIVKAQLKP